MAVESFANAAQTTLGAAITTTNGTSITVTSSTGFPSANFRIQIDSELMLVTNVSGTTWTVTRGAESTTAATHSNGAGVLHVLTAGAIKQFRSDTISSDTYANIPAVGTAGRIYFPTDENYTYFDDGVTWQPYLEGRRVGKPPLVSNLTWNNQGNTTADNTGGVLWLQLSENSAGNIRSLLKSSATPPYKFTIKHRVLFPPANNMHGGLIIRDGSSGKCNILAKYHDTASGWQINLYQFSSNTAFNATLSSQGVGGINDYQWLRVRNDNTNRNYEYSADGQHWLTIYSEAKTTFFTENQYGVYLGTAITATTFGQSILEWLEN